MNLSEDGCRDDRNLADGIKQNDPDAFRILYYRYFKPLTRFAWYRVHSAESARDLVQEVFFRVWVKRENIIPDKSIKSYLYKSLNNLIINYLKLGSTGTVSIERKNIKYEMPEENKIDLELDVINAIEKLPEKMKIVYLLSRNDGYKYSEIAEICGISVKAVEKRMGQAFEILRKHLE